MARVVSCKEKSGSARIELGCGTAVPCPQISILNKILNFEQHIELVNSDINVALH